VLVVSQFGSTVPFEALEDQVLGVGDDRRLLGVGLTLDAEELLLERPAVVEREDV